MIMGRLSLVSSFRRPISLLNCLRKGQRKRQSREKLRSCVSSYSTAEQLEDRTLLAGASLVNIEPNMDLSLTEGEIYNEAPKELTFKFTPGQEIDASTLSGIQIVRSGFDGTFGDSNDVVIDPGYIGIGDNPNEVILRFAETLPDDNYQITIHGNDIPPDSGLPGIPESGVTALRNLANEAFLDGDDQVINFELDLGAKVVAVVAQPVLREQILSITDVAELHDGDTFTITIGDTQATFEMDLDGLGLNDSANIQVAYSAANSATEVGMAVETAFNSSPLSTLVPRQF